MNAAESKGVQIGRRSNDFCLAVLALPSAKLSGIVKKQIARSLTVLHRHCRQRLLLAVKLHHSGKINVAGDVNIVQNKRLVRCIICIPKEVSCLLQAASGIEQNLLARDLDYHPEIIVCGEIVDDHF